jgi:hypothetical protein
LKAASVALRKSEKFGLRLSSVELADMQWGVVASAVTSTCSEWAGQFLKIARYFYFGPLFSNSN